MTPAYTKHTIVRIKHHSQLDETWVRDRIAEDPTILGLGNLDIKDIERIQPRAGRLDLLLHNAETDERYEVELMLGPVDESHIIRTIEYWDNERKRYPQYDHKAVIVAEEITSRFLNVIGLFNQAIPIIALQMAAVQIDDKITLIFTKVLDEIIPGEDDEDDEAVAAAKTRDFWEKKSSKESLPIVDACMAMLSEIAPSVSPNYRAAYIGLKEDSRANNFVQFFPKIGFTGVRVYVPDELGWRQRAEEAGMDLLETKKPNRVRFNLNKDDLQAHLQLLKELFQAAHAAREG